jgi:hypothetical protein
MWSARMSMLHHDLADVKSEMNAEGLVKIENILDGL